MAREAGVSPAAPYHHFKDKAELLDAVAHEGWVMLQEEMAKPIIAYGRAAGCWQPYVKNLTLHVNSIYNNWRFEDIWLDR